METPDNPKVIAWKIKNKMVGFVLVVCALSLLIGFILGKYVYPKTTLPYKAPKLACPVCNNNDEVVVKPSGQFKTFRSDNLGIAFNYYEFGSGDSVKDEVKVKEIDDKVYLYINSSKTELDDPTKGKYIQIKSKEPSSSLASAVSKYYLLENANCKITEYHTIASTLNPTYEYVKVVTDPSCTSPLTQAHGINYFVMDKVHPDKFVLVSLGQDNLAFPITSSDSMPITWDHTITFTK